MTTPTKKRSFSSDVLQFFSASVCSVGMKFVATVVIARALGPTGRGVISLFVLVGVVLQSVFCLGIHQANVYYADPKRSRVGALLSNSTFYLLAVAVIVTPAMWIFQDYILSWLKLQDYRTAYRWSCLLFPLMLANVLFVNILVGEKRFLERNISVLLLYGTQLLATIAFVWGAGMGVLGGVLAVVLGYFLAAAFILFRLNGFSIKLFRRPDKKLMKESVVYGVKGQLGSLMQLFNYRIDMFFVNRFLDAGSVGIYSVSVSIGELVWMLPQVVGNVLFAMSSGDQDKYNDNYVASAVRKSLLLMTCGGAALIAASYVMVPLIFGNKFAASVIPLALLIPGIIGVGVYKILVFALMGKGFPEYTSYAAGITLGLMIPLDMLLIPLWGVPGASLASTFAYLACAAFTLRWYVRHSKMSWREIVVPKWEDVLYFFQRANGIVAKYRRRPNDDAAATTSDAEHPEETSP